EADARFQLARRSADEMIRIANEELADEPGQSDARRRLLETAQVFYQEFIDLRRGDPSAKADLEQTSEKLAKLLEQLKVLDFAWQHHMLREPSVRDDLKLNTEQRARIDTMLLEVPGPPGEFGDGPGGPPPEPRRQTKYATFMDEVTAHENVIVETLSKDQLHRLRQIGLHAGGPAAFRQPEIARALGLTAEQLDRIRRIEPERKGDRRGGPGRGGPDRGGPDHGGPQGMSPEARRRAVDEILAL